VTAARYDSTVRATGSEMREEHVLRDGTRIVVRHIRPDDAAALKDAFERLSPTSRYRRFLAGVSSLSEAQLRYLTDVDGEDHVAIVATQLDATGEPREFGLGVARFIRVAGEPRVAEAAITVADDVQRRGVGRALAMTLARAAVERGIDHFRGEILADNAAVRQLLEDVGATIVRNTDGNLVFDVALAGAPHTETDAPHTETDAPETEKPRQPSLDEVARRLLEAATQFVFGPFRRHP
jgi:GNAT superfamily N-acetyltransferase